MTDLLSPTFLRGHENVQNGYGPGKGETAFDSRKDKKKAIRKRKNSGRITAAFPTGGEPFLHSFCFPHQDPGKSRKTPDYAGSNGGALLYIPRALTVMESSPISFFSCVFFPPPRKPEAYRENATRHAVVDKVSTSLQVPGWLSVRSSRLNVYKRISGVHLDETTKEICRTQGRRLVILVVRYPPRVKAEPKKPNWKSGFL